MANVSSSNGLEKRPKLRFPGFDEPWRAEKLSDFAERVTRKNSNNETDLPLTISSKDGLVDQISYFNKTVASKDMSGYYLLRKGEYAYNKSYSVGYDFGSIKRLDRYPMGALSTLIQMQRPVQNVDMRTKAPFKLLVKFADNECQRTRWNGFFHGANLVDTFLWAGLVVFQKILYRTVALGVPGFLVPGILGIHMVGIMLVVIHTLDFFKAEIRLSRALPKFRGSEATIAVPVHIFLGSLGINVFAVLHIKPTVIVPGIIGAMLARASVMPCQFQFPSLQSPLIFPKGKQRRSRQTCGFLRQVIPSTN